MPETKLARELADVSTHFFPPDHIKIVWEHLNDEAFELSAELAPDEELIANVILFGGREILVNEFSYAGPNLLIVQGEQDGRLLTVYVHQSCLQVVFSKVVKDERTPHRPIGFIPPQISEDSAGEVTPE